MHEAYIAILFRSEGRYEYFFRMFFLIVCCSPLSHAPSHPPTSITLITQVWLEDWLMNFAGMVIIVSHDMYFLDSVCTDMLELKTKLGGSNCSSLSHYNGDYRTYVDRATQDWCGKP